jgi:hypothetical protein
MKWSADKSNVVNFTKAKRLKAQVPIFHLGSIELKPARQYTYLGLTLQANGKWDQHFNSIKKKAAYSSYLIQRVIQRHGPPTPATIRQFTIAIPRARLIWALPFWQPNKSQYTAMDRILTQPLRSALHLPRCTSRAALFSEYGLANLQLTREYQQLAYASRLLGGTLPAGSFPFSPSLSSASDPSSPSSPPQHPARTLLQTNLTRPDTDGSNQLYSKPYWQQLLQLQSQWDVDLSTTTGLALKQQMLQRQLELYQHTPPSTSSPGLRPFKQSPGASLYLYLDPKPVAAMRAKLRFDLASLAGSVMGHRMDTASQACILCDEPAADTRHHLLLHCPVLYCKRRKLCLDLMSDGDDHLMDSDTALLSFLLGNLPSTNRLSQQLRSALKQSGQFIQLIFALRFHHPHTI